MLEKVFLFMWTPPEDNGFRPKFHRKFAYGYLNSDIVAEFQMKSYSERVEFEKKLIEDNPDLYKQFKFWCKHMGYLKDFYNYEDPVYISFEGEEWETLVEESRKIKDNVERTLFLVKNYSQSKQFYSFYENYFKNRRSIKDLLDEPNLSFKLHERLLNLKFDGPFELVDIFLKNIYDDSDKKRRLSFLFKNPDNGEILYLIPNSKNQTLRYISQDGFLVYNFEGLGVEKEYKYDF